MQTTNGIGKFMYAICAKTANKQIQYTNLPIPYLEFAFFMGYCKYSSNGNQGGGYAFHICLP